MGVVDKGVIVYFGVGLIVGFEDVCVCVVNVLVMLC